MKSVLVGSESGNAYQAFREHLELIISFEVLLFENTYKIDQVCS